MATSNTFSITAGVTSFACDFGATDKETIVLTISSTGAVISSNDYSVLGVAASATAGDITIEWDDAGDYVGETLIISKFTEIDTGSPSDAMLVNFTTSGTTNPTNIQNEFAHLYDIVGQITGGTAVGTYDIADIGTVITRLNDLADDIFTTTTNSGTPAIWDGTNTLSIGGDTNVQSILTTHETRLDAAESDIDTAQSDIDTAQSDITTLETNVAALNIAAGFPNPFVVAGQDVALADAGTYFTTDNVEAALQQIALYQRRIATIAAASRLDHVETLSTTADARCIALYGQYGVIGAGTGGDNIWRSSNYGRSWALDTGIDAIISWDVFGLAFNSDGSVLVAVGGKGAGTHSIASSANYGATWTGRQDTGTVMEGVCWSGSLFVAVGLNGAIYTSSNGTSGWTSRTADGTPANIDFKDVCWSDELDLFIAVGTDSTGGAHIEIQTSTDGVTWVARTAAATSETTLYSVREIDFGSSTYIIATGQNGEIQYSANGISWTAHGTSNITSAGLDSICQVPTGALIGDNLMRMSLLTDGTTRGSNSRFPEDNVAPAATAGPLRVEYSAEFGIVAAGTNGNIWQSFTGSFA